MLTEPNFCAYEMESLVKTAVVKKYVDGSWMFRFYREKSRTLVDFLEESYANHVYHRRYNDLRTIIENEIDF